MEYRKFLLKDVGHPFDGLIVYVDEDDYKDLIGSSDLIKIYKVQQNHLLFGSFSLPVEGLWIESDRIEEYNEEESEQETANPYGNHQYDCKIEKDKNVLVWVVYEKGVSVSLRNNNSAIYSHAFLGQDKKDAVLGLLYDIQQGHYDWDMLAYEFKKIEKDLI